MSSHPRFACLLSCLMALAFALPAQADIASPERNRRKAAVSQWHRKHPGTVPAMELSLSPDGKTLAVRFEARTPADYAISLDGMEAAKGSVQDLKGGVRTVAIPLAGQSCRRCRIAVDFSLKGVQGTGADLRPAGDSISGCLIKRFEIVEKNGKPLLKELGLDGGDYFDLRRCGL
jgi:hypothetical protein